MEFTFQPWITIAGRTSDPASEEPTIITQPLAQAFDLSGVRAGTLRIDLTDVEGGAQLFIGVAPSLTTGVITLAEIDTANLPSRQSVSFQINAGEISLVSPESGTVSATGYGRYLMWFVVGPVTDDTPWSVSFHAVMRIQAAARAAGAMRNVELRTVPDIQGWVRLHADGVGFDNIEQTALDYVDTRNRSRFALDIDLPRLDNATLTIETSATAEPSSWVTATTLTDEGVAHLLLTRDQGASSTTTLRNFVRWRLHRVTEAAFGGMLRITGSAG